jgi:Protein of unknown function (DUF3606)
VADNLHIKQPQDPTKINVNEWWEVTYWTQKFGVTPAQLKTAVDAVGTSAAAVKKYLGK